jgi:hypothetical protein
MSDQGARCQKAGPALMRAPPRPGVTCTTAATRPLDSSSSLQPKQPSCCGQGAATGKAAKHEQSDNPTLGRSPTLAAAHNSQVERTEDRDEGVEREDVSTQISASPRALRCSNLLQPARLRSSETTLKWKVHAAAYYYYYCCCLLLLIPRRNSFASHRVAGSADVDGPSYSGCTCLLAAFLVCLVCCTRWQLLVPKSSLMTLA